MSGLRGKIASVSLKDFVTYDYVTFYPGQQLNVIIGPNGTGKSTLVAAIVLGMGGSPKVLSRALNIGDYVKNGKRTATITIGIFRSATEPADIATFQREIDLDGTSRFQLDERRCTQTAFLRAVHELNIQVDNLCQFLPQDRVQDFAKQNAQELLASTQSSVCSPEVEAAFGKLCELRERQRSEGGSREQNSAKLAECERLNGALEARLQTIERRNALIADLDVCTKKRAWMEFEELYLKHRELSGDLERAEENLGRHEREMQPLQQQIAQIDAAKAEYQGRIAKETRRVDGEEGQLEAAAERGRQVLAEMAKARADYEFARTGNEERAQELAAATSIQQVLIADVRAQQAAAGTEDERKEAVRSVVARLAEKRAAVQRLLSERHEINERLHETIKPQLLNAANRIKAAESVGDRKLELLRNKYEHAYRGVMWLRENRELFRGHVYEPMLLELNVMDSRNAKYIEQCASTRDLIAFTCEFKEDMELMHRHLRREQGLNVNLIHSPPAERCEYRAPRPIEELAEFGFWGYLIDLIEGPAPLLNALCKNNRLHAVPVGDERTFEMAEQLPADVSLFFTTNHRFQIIRSKYSKQTSSTCNEIKTINLLNIGTDQQQLARLKEAHARLLRDSDKLHNERTRIETELQRLDAACTDLAAERQQITAKTQALVACQEKLRWHMAKLKRMPVPVDLQAERAKLHSTLRTHWQTAIRLQTELGPTFAALCSAVTARDLHSQRYAKFLHSNHTLHSELQTRQDEADKARRLVTRIRELVDRNKRACREKQSAAKRLTDGRTPSDAAQFPWREAFDKLPGLLEELRSHMNELQGEIDCLAEQGDRGDGDGGAGGGGGGESVVAEYEARRDQIEQLRTALADHEQQNAQLQQEMSELHAKWLPIVQGTVEVISAQFSAYMSALRFAGEVALTSGPTEHDYAEYGIDIRVKYRGAERLQTLDRNVQSGGERAVAIAVYSLSLQQISHVPFRCVDEINQGMDATNERKIFDMLVEETGKPGKSQYFFVTPKLLPNLAYNEGMRVHVVHNGRFVRDKRTFERKWE